MLLISGLQAQTRYYTKNGSVSFSASSPLETIEAVNEKAVCVLDLSTGSLESAVLMKAFRFDRALMQEHFNEDYVESDRYPKAVFKGISQDIKNPDLSKNGIFPVKITGSLSLHGITKNISVQATLEIKNGIITKGKCQFSILLSDFNIEIPSVVKDKISKEVHISVDASFESLKTP